MKQLNFKKTLLTVVGLVLALCANATTGDIQTAGYQPDGATWGCNRGEGVTVDFSSEAIKAVIDLTGCNELTNEDGTEAAETVLSIGGKITAEHYMLSGGVIHVFYYATSKKLEVAWNGGTGTVLYKGAKTLDDVTNVQIELSKAYGLTVNGEVWGADQQTDGTSASLSAETLLADGPYSQSILSQTALFVGVGYGNASHATYNTLAVISADEVTVPTGGGSEEESLEVILAEDFTADGTGFTYVSPIDWDKQYISISVDVTSQNTANIISIGKEGASNKWDDAIHSYWTTATGGGQTSWYPGSHDPTRVDNLNYTGGTMLIELSKANGYVVDGEQKFTPENLSDILALTTIELSDMEGNIRSTFHYNWIKIAPIPVEVVYPDSLTLPVTNYTPVEEHDYKFTTSTTPEEVDFVHNGIQAVLDLSTCTDEGEEVLCFGENTDSRDANWIRFTYKPANKVLSANVRVKYNNTYASVGPVDVQLDQDTLVSLTLCKEGVLLGDTIMQCEDPYGDVMGGSASWITLGSTNVESVIGLDKIEINSVNGDVRSHATYKSIAIVKVVPDTIIMHQDSLDYVVPTVDNPKLLPTVQLVKTLKLNEWNTICLPFSVDSATVVKQFGEGTKLAVWKKSLTSKGYPEFESTDSIDAGLPYLINPTAEGAVAVNDSTNAYQFDSVAVFVEEPADTIEITVGEKHFSFLGSFTPALYVQGEGISVWSPDGVAFVEAQKNDGVTVPTETPGFHAVLATDSVDLYMGNWTLDGVEMNPVTKPEAIPFDLTREGGWYAGGDTFAWDSDIDWTKQALEIVLDLSSCTSTANQNVTSIAGTEDDLAAWTSDEEAGHIHFYYTKSTNKMEVNYLIGTSNTYRNGNYSLFHGTANNDTILVSMDGVDVNGQNWTGTSEYGSYTAFDQTTISPLTSLTHIWVGSTQGDGRSWATYKSIKIIDFDPAANGISNLDKNTEAATSYNVYNLNGQMVKSNAQNVNDLPKGLYIVNGKKMILK